MNRKFMLFLSALLTIIFLAACGTTPESPGSSGVAPALTQQPESREARSEPASAEPDPTVVPVETPESDQANILIAYFTWAENTYVDDPDSVDVDATTSASVLLPGNAAKLANWIQQEVGGDLFSIVVEEPYSSDYDECLDRAADEKAADARPALVGHVEDMSQYDIVFLGFPNWWYTVPMAVHSFLDEYDFSGKTIVPFVTHGTGGLASTIEDIATDLPDSVTMLDPIGVYRPDVDNSQQAVLDWLAGLDLPQK